MTTYNLSYNFIIFYRFVYFPDFLLWKGQNILLFSLQKFSNHI